MYTIIGCRTATRAAQFRHQRLCIRRLLSSRKSFDALFGRVSNFDAAAAVLGRLDNGRILTSLTEFLDRWNLVKYGVNDRRRGRGRSQTSPPVRSPTSPKPIPQDIEKREPVFKFEIKLGRTGDDERDESKKDDEEDDEEKRKQKFRKRMMMFVGGTVAFWLVVSMLQANSWGEEISWSEFISQVLPTGQVYKITVFPEDDRAILHLYHGARSVGGVPLASRYSMTIPNMAEFERQVQATQEALNLNPDQWAAIEIKRFEQYGNWIGVIVSILFLAFLISVLRGFKRIDIRDFISQGTRNWKTFDRGTKVPKTRFRDIAGLHEAKAEISEFVDYLKHPTKYARLGAKLPKGALLTGPPGCGKTLLAKAVAAESTVPFISINGTEFVEAIGGLGASRVRGLFKDARQRAPCIIYIDEIDAIGRKRSGSGADAGSGGHQEGEHTLNQLLVEMDGMDSSHGVIMLASTNRPDILDKALIRPGRLDRHILIDWPTIAERQEIFNLYLSKVKLDKRPQYYSQRLAQMTPGFSGADIGNVVNEAAIHAASTNLKIIGMKELDHAMQRVLAGPEKRSRTLVDEEREVVAYHESGHALVAWLLEHTDALLKVTIIPRTNATLGFAQYAPADRKLYSKEELYDRMCVMLGGRAAENVTFGRITTGAQDDLEKVTKSAYAQVKVYGMSDILGPLSFGTPPSKMSSKDSDDARQEQFYKKPYSGQMQQAMDQEVSRLVANAYYATESLLKSNHDKLEKLAKALLQHEVLNYEDVKKLIGPPLYGEKAVIELVDQSLPQPPTEEESD